MVVRKRKRVNRLLGQRTRGNGDTKNRRGAGSRGGRGLAGSHKHKYAKYHGKFGKEKKKLRSKKYVNAVNIDQLMQQMPKLVASGKVLKESGLLVVDGKKTGIDKLLSAGSLEEKLLVRNMKASKKAVEKLEKAGGKFEKWEEEKLEGEEDYSEEAEEGKEEGPEGKEKKPEVKAGKPEEKKGKKEKE